MAPDACAHGFAGALPLAAAVARPGPWTGQTRNAGPHMNSSATSYTAGSSRKSKGRDRSKV